MTYNSGLGAYELSWQPPAPAADGDTAARYAVYRFFSPPEPASYDLPQNLLTLTGTPTIVPPARVDSMDVRYYYAVTALDRNNNESGPSGAVSIVTPVPAPVLLSPVDGEQFYARGAMLTWRKVEGAIVYRLQLDSSGAFLPGTMLLNVLTPDTSDVPLDLKAGKTYTWRVIAGAVVRRESRFDPTARSGAGALGLAQFVPEWGRRLGADEDTLWDGDVALALAARELARLGDRFGPRLEVVAAAYNAGDLVTAMWDGWLGPSAHATLFAAAVPYRETAGYVVAVREGSTLTRDLDAAVAP